ncbi:bridge-like lipid transfer protein family member 3A isoform X1 [Paramormyrops kingsleyae]|uniref:bridge-like lipid transfer protein family member 3A isoform X1 n=1 Tax=Paramormyrops kingsleyae TaxID=1676925 RepID=UPI000CD634B9|nr:UHRF1-binding protein 1 isoform X1 [Paramormyrops kingsleyae]
MAGIIKKQILKHLSRFTKNLSPDKINLSTLKGEGQLSNLELDEEVLQNMLDLPTWLAVTRVYCNKAAIRIQWTKLKTNPICLFLDKVEVEMRTCEEPRSPNGPSPIAITAGQSEYGFAEKVVEGMSVVINSITIKVQARAFHASFELWQLQGTSLNPKWQRSDLRYTRITDPRRGEVLTFKEINWQSLRIEADAMESQEQDLGSTPLRLITNQGRIRIALKRRVKDCNVLASKLLFILDDLLWVLTDSQLKAVIHYAKSLSEAMDKSAQQRKSMAGESLQAAPPSPVAHSSWAEPAPPPSGAPSNLSQYFELHDVKESSYHTYISRLDLHICNDSSTQSSDESQPPGPQGSMQLTFRKLGFDYYPFHRPVDGSRHWERHCGAMETQSQWADGLLQEFQRRLEASGIPGGHSESLPIRRTQEGEPSPKSSPPERGHGARHGSSPWKRLRSSCVVVRVDDLDVHQVSTGGRHSKKTQSFLSCNRKALHLDDSVPAFYGQFTEYYFPESPGLPVPCSSLFAQLNGVQLCLDPASVLWMNLFSQGLLSTLEQVKAFYHLQDSGKGEEHVEARMDAAQLKVIIPLETSILDHPDRPQSLSISFPHLVMSNTRHSPHGSRADLHATYRSFSSCPFFQPPPPCPFPRDRSTFHPLPPTFLRHSAETGPLLVEAKPARSRDIWAISLSQLALSFEGSRRGLKGKPLPFLEPFSMSIWMCRPSAFENDPPRSLPFANYNLRPSDSYEHSSEVLGHPPKSQTDCDLLQGDEARAELPMASVHILAQATSPIKLWLNHYQYIALLRMKDTLGRLGAELSRDAMRVGGKKAESLTVCVALLMEVVEVGLLLPPVIRESEAEPRSPEETDSPSLTDSERSPSQTPHMEILEDSGIGNGPAAPGRDVDGPVEEACEALEEVGEEKEECQVVRDPSSPSFSPGHQPSLSRKGSSFSLEGELSSALTATKDATRDALSASLDLTKGAFSITKDAFSLLSRGSAVSKMLFTPQMKDQNQRSEEAPFSIPGALRLTPIRQSPSQHSLDSAILDGSLPEDRFSLDSDTSENLTVHVDSESGLESMRPESIPGAPTDPAYRGNATPGNEGGSSADLSSSLSQSTEDIAQDTAAVLLLQLSSFGCSMDMKGDDLVVALDAQTLTTQQLGNQKLSELLAVLTRHQPSAPVPNSPAANAGPVVRARMELGPSAGRHSPLAESAGFLEMRVTGCRAELLTTTLSTLGPFLEDELSADIQPMRLYLDNATITLKDDGPQIYPTSPQPMPVVFMLNGVVLERFDDGVFCLRAGGSDTEKPPAEGVATGQTEACWQLSDCSPSVRQQENHEVQCTPLEIQLQAAQAALAQAVSDRQHLLQEVRKYDPLFNL